MKRKIIVFLLGLCIISVSLGESVENIKAGLNDVYYKENSNEVYYGSSNTPIFVDGYYCHVGWNTKIYAAQYQGKVLKFPSTIKYNHKSYKVKVIGEKLEDKSNYYFPNDKFPADYFPGYKNKGNVKKMMIPNGVKKVVLRTLHTWKNLKEIRIPASVNGKDLYLSHTNGKIVIEKKNKKYKTSGNGVYTKDTKKLKATFGTKKTFLVKKGTKSVEMEAFLYNKNVKKVTFPSSIKNIDITTFNGCKHLKSITLQGEKAPLFGKKSDLQGYQIEPKYEWEFAPLQDMPKKVTVYVKNKKVKKAIEKTLKIGNLKKLKWKVKVG